MRHYEGNMEPFVRGWRRRKEAGAGCSVNLDAAPAPTAPAASLKKGIEKEVRATRTKGCKLTRVSSSRGAAGDSKTRGEHRGSGHERNLENRDPDQIT